MDFNIILERFGFDSSNFVNKSINTIKFDEGIIYEAFEEYKAKICPFCNNEKLFIHDYKWININLTTTLKFKEILRIKRIRYKCPKCTTSFHENCITILIKLLFISC